MVCSEEAPGDGNIMGGRFLLVVNNTHTRQLAHIALLVVQVPAERDKYILAQSANTTHQNPIRLLTSVSAVLVSRLCI